jgi:hypothetical protein
MGLKKSKSSRIKKTKFDNPYLSEMDIFMRNKDAYQISTQMNFNIVKNDIALRVCRCQKHVNA